MKLFLVLTSAYFAICLGVVLVTPGVGIAAFEGVWARAMSLVPALANAALGLFCLAVLARQVRQGQKDRWPTRSGRAGFGDRDGTCWNGFVAGRVLDVQNDNAVDRSILRGSPLGAVG